MVAWATLLLAPRTNNQKQARDASGVFEGLAFVVVHAWRFFYGKHCGKCVTWFWFNGVTALNHQEGKADQAACNSDGIWRQAARRLSMLLTWLQAKTDEQRARDNMMTILVALVLVT